MASGIAGFVLVGGASSRMGRDKALLPLGEQTMAQRVAAAVQEAAGSVTLVGDPQRYGGLGYAVIADPVSGFGPVAGIAAAVNAGAEWNLVVACDMPAVTADFLRALLDTARASECDCILPVGPSGRPEPLCAVYHRRCLAPLQQALRNQVHKVMLALSGARVQKFPVGAEQYLANLNTPDEFDMFKGRG
jgi:molybdopterin-guanine dinucleotide biosynthesis protein A